MLRAVHPWIWAAVVAVACVTALFLFGETPVYEAHAAVAAEPSGNGLLDSDALVLKAARKAGLQADAEFNRPAGNAGLVANAKGRLALRNDGQLVQVNFTARDPRKAAAFANALVDAYNDEMESRGLARAVELTAGLEALRELIEQKEARLSNPRLSAAKAEALIIEVNRQHELYGAMLRRVAAPRSAPRFASHAAAPDEPINSNPWAGLIYGVPLTLLGGLLFVVSRRRLEQMPEPLVQPDVMCSQGEIEKPIVAVSNAGTGFTNPETLLDYVENLLASGQSVLIIDCELGGALTEWVGLRGEYGFTDFLMDSPTLRGMMPAWKTNRERVSVMPVGTRPNRIPVLLTGACLREALAVLLVEFDRVVINAPPVLTTGEMRDLSPLVDGVILVAAEERSMGLAHLAVRQVEEFGGRVIGLVEDPNQLAVL